MEYLFMINFIQPSKENMIRVAITDDKINNRKVIADKLSCNSLITLVFEAVNGDDFLTQLRALPENKRPHIVLMDLEMPEIDGVATIGTASSLYPDIKFVVLTIFDDDDKIFKSICAGAEGYILKHTSPAEILESIKEIYLGGSPMTPSIANRVLNMVKEKESRQKIKN